MLKLLRLLAAASLFATAFCTPAMAQPALQDGTVIGGKMKVGGLPPTVAATCTIEVGATDMTGRVTAAGGATSCVVTFSSTWTIRPKCFVNDETGTRAAMSTVTTATTLTVAGLTTADVFVYVCWGSI